MVVVTTGGGGDGYPVLNAYLSMLESESRSFPLKSILITGPFMPGQERREIFDRARRLGVRTYKFYRWMEKILAAADVVVGMGGYNTVCEVLTQKTPALIIPRENPRKEQLIRSQVLHGQGLINYSPWHSLTPDTLKNKLFTILEHPKPYQEAMARFQMTGFDVMSERLLEIRKKRNGAC